MAMHHPFFTPRRGPRTFGGVHVQAGPDIVRISVMDGTVRAINQISDGRHPARSSRTRHDVMTGRQS
jgi:hypothetical protein